MLATTAVLALTPSVASAAEIEVDTSADGPSDCTLRAAIAAANTDLPAQSCDAGSGTDTITFEPTVFPPNGGTTITLGAQLAVTSSMTIQGPGSAALQLSGGSAVRIFVVDGPAAQNVEISGMTMSLGSIQGGSPQRGGAVLNGADSTLSLHNVVIQQSSIEINQSSPGSATLVGEGGGVYSAGDLSVAGSTIYLNLIDVINSATGVTSVIANGGGIAMGPGASLSVTESDVRRNSALTVDTMGPLSQTSGGGIYAGDAVITQTSVTENQSIASSDSGFSSAGGGGITVGGTASRIELDTIGDNNVVSSGGTDQEAKGGGLLLTATGVPIVSSTFFQNGGNDQNEEPANSDGANINAVGGSGTIVSSIIANPVALNGGATNCDGGTNLTSLGFNIITGFVASGNCPWPVHPTDQVGPDPLLGPLAPNGAGPAQSYLPQPGSAAVDKGSSTLQTIVQEDQRGSDRPLDFTNLGNASGGDASDIGSVEVQAKALFDTTSPSSPSGSDMPLASGAVQADGAGPTTVSLFSDAGCGVAAGAPSPASVFASPGIAGGPVPHNATTTFRAKVQTPYGTTACSSGPHPFTLAYTQDDALLPPPPPDAHLPPPPPPPPPAVTKTCKKGKKLKQGKCVSKKHSKKKRRKD
jgi:hypothetical protein